MLPTRFIPYSLRLDNFIFGFGLIAFAILDTFFINHQNPNILSIIIPSLIFALLNIFYEALLKLIKKTEQILTCPSLEDNRLFQFKLAPFYMEDRKIFKYHHVLFCSSIVFFIASKTMAAKFISIGSITINVGGIVFSLAYLTADIMTDVYGIERTKQMILFVIFATCCLSLTYG